MRRVKLLGAIGSALLLAVLGLSAIERAEISVAQPTLQSITVVVQVTHCATQAPIPEAKVNIVEKASQKVLAQGLTDAQGRFSAVILILAFGIADALEKIDVLIEKAGFQLQQLTKVVLSGPFGPFISVNACLLATGSQAGQLACSPITVTGPTLTLQPGQSLQQAIDQASEGTVIQLQAGEYPISTSLRITKGISLIGLGTKPDPNDPTKSVPDPEKVVLRGNRAKPVIIVQTEGKVFIANLAVREGSGAGPTERGGAVHIENSKDVTLRCVILTENVRFGLFARLSQVRIEESQVLKTQPATPGRDGHGLRIRGSTVQVSKTVIRENGASGLAALDETNTPSSVTVEESRIEQNVIAGLFVSDRSKLEVRRSRIANNQPFQGEFGDGVSAEGMAELVLEGNTIEGHRLAGQFGVLLLFFVRATLTSNEIRNNGWGVAVGNPGISFEKMRVAFFNNRFASNNQCGLWIDEDPQIVISGSGNLFAERPGRAICGATSKVPSGF